MKLSLLMAIVLLAISSMIAELYGNPTTDEDTLTELHKKLLGCIEQNNITQETMEALANPDPADYPYELKCYLKCIYEVHGFYKDGKMVEEKMITLISNQTKNDQDNNDGLMKVFTACQKIVGDDECDTLAKQVSCMGKS